MNLYLSEALIFSSEEATTLSQQAKGLFDRAGPVIIEIVRSRTDLYLQIEIALQTYRPMEKEERETYETLIQLRVAHLADYLTHEMDIDPSRILLGETPGATFPPKTSPRLRIVLVPPM